MTSPDADAPIICCTAEILANQSLREGPTLDADMIVMDEFHFYGGSSARLGRGRCRSWS